jgi:hypothetical protein
VHHYRISPPWSRLLVSAVPKKKPKKEVLEKDADE